MEEKNGVKRKKSVLIEVNTPAGNFVVERVGNKLQLFADYSVDLCFIGVIPYYANEDINQLSKRVMSYYIG